MVGGETVADEVEAMQAAFAADLGAGEGDEGAGGAGGAKEEEEGEGTS